MYNNAHSSIITTHSSLEVAGQTMCKAVRRRENNDLARQWCHPAVAIEHNWCQRTSFTILVLCVFKASSIDEIEYFAQIKQPVRVLHIV